MEYFYSQVYSSHLLSATEMEVGRQRNEVALSRKERTNFDLTSGLRNGNLKSNNIDDSPDIEEK